MWEGSVSVLSVFREPSFRKNKSIQKNPKQIKPKTKNTPPPSNKLKNPTNKPNKKPHATSED